ncbi:MAG TPA: hypothetical protein VFW42_00950 [Fluviicoccus sp.]|nr:hypothetical protein [Fluviicoccus sp.]
MRRDFSFLESLIHEFFTNEKISRYFKTFAEYEIKGWENWLQIELAHFFSRHDSGLEWKREVTLKFDGRKERNKIYFRPDFILRKKHWTLGRYVALEIKQDPSPTACLNKLLSDIDKVSKIRPSELNIRSLWGLGITKLPEYKEPLPFLLEHIDEKSNVMLAKRIGNTEYVYFIF